MKDFDKIYAIYVDQETMQSHILESILVFKENRPKFRDTVCNLRVAGSESHTHTHYDLSALLKIIKLKPDSFCEECKSYISSDFVDFSFDTL
ncbi:hypothetical protein LEP1GSC047_4245 [Leptospira inadai serovar Lyme str. 10]|uniref:Uncharacterized protein n=2 Tax=Leptospira inadai serovar Lyme TaxID=293084 RepID=V6HD03_9LEPT|nr:hypothetical protein [Leptospira inadai]EQA37647.1 hypothetical protein LEP1GSC047_4245 [Leptospira inadai serovar Lyme str. 10]